MTIPLLLLGFVLLAVIAQAILGVTYTSKYQRYVESLRAGGEPFWFDELHAARAVIPDAENSAKIIERMTDELRNLGNGVDDLVMEFGARGPSPDPFHGTPRYTIAPTREFLQKNAHLLSVLKEIRNKPRGRFDVQYDAKDIVAPFLPSMAPVRHAVKLTSDAISIDILDGNCDSAWDRLPVLFRLCGVYHDEPCLISRLVQNACEAFAVRAVKQLLCAREFSASQVAGIDELLVERLANPNMAWALRSERFVIEDFCSSLGRGLLPISPPAKATLISPLWKYAPPSLVRRNHLEYTRLLTFLAGKANDARALMVAADLANAWVSGMWTKSVVLEDLVPSIHRSIEIDTEVHMMLETARCAIAGERYRLKNGAFPASLEALVPEFLPGIPVDAFGTGNLMLKIEGETWTVYSVGDDREDDGGDVVIEWNSADEDGRASDVGFRLLPPEKRGVIILDIPPPDEDE